VRTTDDYLREREEKEEGQTANARTGGSVAISDAREPAAPSSRMTPQNDLNKRLISVPLEAQSKFCSIGI